MKNKEPGKTYLFLYSFIAASVADENMDSIKLNNSAQKNPSTLIPSINLSAIIMISALITKRKSPIVIIVMGSVKRISSGFRNVFSNASTKAKRSAVT